MHTFQSLTTMNEYKAEFPFPLIFPPQQCVNVLAECLAKNNLTQFHCAGRFIRNQGLSKPLTLRIDTWKICVKLNMKQVHY